MLRINCTCLASTSKTLLLNSTRINYSIRSFSNSNLINSEITIPSTPTVPKPSASAIPTSSVPAGTILKGLNFLKTASDPLATEDSEYPAWLFQFVTPPSKGKGLVLSEDEKLKKESRSMKKDRGTQIKAMNNLKSR